MEIVRAIILMQAFCDTRSDFHMEKTGDMKIIIEKFPY